MKKPRVVFVTRRFWPLVGGAHASLGLLASELARRGAECRIVTIRWQPDWPAVIDHHGVPVYRLLRPRTGRWGDWFHARRLQHWLRENCPGPWTVCVSGLRQEAAAVLRAARGRDWRVVLRSEGAGLTGDCHIQLDAPGGRKIKRTCMQADAFIAPTRACETELIAAGYPRGRIHHVPSGVPLFEETTAAVRKAARQVLATAHPALSAPEDAPLAVYTGRLEAERGLDYLIAAWPGVVARWPQARLWLIGEGPAAKSLAEQVRGLGLAGAIAMPGAFDSVDDVLAAADLYVAPAIDTGTSLGLLSAMAAGLPTVATDLPGHQEFVDHEIQGLLTPARDPAALGAALLRLLADRDFAQKLGERAREQARAEYSLERMVERHAELFMNTFTIPG